MHKWEINLLSHCILENIPEYDLPQRAALISALLNSVDQFEPELLNESRHDELIIHHRYRASLSNYKGEVILPALPQRLVDNALEITFQFHPQDAEAPHPRREIVFSVSSFPDLLNDRGILDAENQSKLFHDVCGLFFPEEEQDVPPKYLACYDMIVNMRDIYNAAGINSAYRNFIETTIGAAIFYLPHGVDFWSGQISVEALKLRLRGMTPTKDHKYPRKKAAAEALSKNYARVQDFIDDYRDQFASFTWLTSNENKRIINFYLDDQEYEEALAGENIELLDFTDSQHLTRFCREIKRTPADYHNLDWNNRNMVQGLINNIE